MNALSRCNLSLLAAFALAACAPHHYVAIPAVAGRVLDRSSKEPVADAVVSLTAGKATVQTRTDTTGNFHLAARQHWGWLPFPSDGYLLACKLQVTAIGYRPYSQDYGGTFFVTRDQWDERLQHVQIGLRPRPNHALQPTAGASGALFEFQR